MSPRLVIPEVLQFSQPTKFLIALVIAAQWKFLIFGYGSWATHGPLSFSIQYAKLVQIYILMPIHFHTPCNARVAPVQGALCYSAPIRTMLFKIVSPRFGFPIMFFVGSNLTKTVSAKPPYWRVACCTLSKSCLTPKAQVPACKDQRADRRKVDRGPSNCPC